MEKTSKIITVIVVILFAIFIAFGVTIIVFETSRIKLCESEVLSLAYDNYVEDLEYGSIIMGIKLERLDFKSVSDWYKRYCADEWGNQLNDAYKITVYYFDENDDKVKEAAFIAIISYTPFNKILDLDIAEVKPI